MSQISISNVINISVLQPGAGLGEYNTSNLALFTDEVAALSFGLSGYKLYLSPDDVATDFGTSSNTYKMAVAVFSQKPNILAGGGYLVVVQLDGTLAETILSTKDVIQYFGVMTAAIVSDADMLAAAALIQTLNKIALFVSNDSASVESGGLLDKLRTGGYTQSRGLFYGSQAIIETQSLTFSSVPTAGSYTLGYNGDDTGSLAYTTDAAGIQTIFRTFVGLSSVVVSGTYANGFTFYFAGVDGPAFPITIVSNTLTNSASQNVVITQKVITPGVSSATAVSEALQMMAAYASRGLSVDFNGSNTTLTMHLKDLATIQPDPSMNQTLLNKCELAGADVYISIQGVSKVFCSGANSFFDDVYNLQWLVGALQVAGFNALAQVGTKVPQTENGMSILKGAYRQVCEQAVTNQYSAPGSWTSTTFFGNQADLIANVAQRGYYIFSAPVAQQNPVNRAARQAPLVQIAIKAAGAIHSSNVIVSVNA